MSLFGGPIGLVADGYQLAVVILSELGTASRSNCACGVSACSETVSKDVASTASAIVMR